MTRRTCHPLKTTLEILFTGREINRPKFAHFYYDNLPLINEANKQRQSVLNLENCWSPKDCWFKLLITLTAMSIVDMHQWHRHKTLALADAATRASSLITSIRQCTNATGIRH
jgi:hypothetical protein